MTKLLVLRNRLRQIYSNYEALLRPVWKFFLSVILIVYINQVLGYDKRLTSIPVVLLLSAVSAFVSAQIVMLIMAVLVLLHIYKAAALFAVLVLAVFLILYLLFERFTPEYAYIVIIMPFAMSLHMPLFPALLIGLVAEPAGVVTAACGIVVYFLIKLIKNVALSGTVELTLETTLVSFQSVMDRFFENSEMFLYLAAVAAVIIVVYIIQRQSIAYSFYIAIMAGSVLFLMMLLIGELVLKINGSPLALLLGSIISALLSIVIQFLLLPLDFSRVEMVQFDDDDYYYYVKAVPKMQVAAPNKSVKRINAQKVTGNTVNLQELVQQLDEQLDEDIFEEEPSGIFETKVTKQ